ncbi:MAG: hypothetical protein JOZ54_23850, partial [Acidobacteria bacterium]|nr:hypothetical protein [Acidobacteriota bacterium]
NSEIPIAKSIVDYIFRWLGSRFLGPDDKAALGLIDRSAVVGDAYAGFGSAASAPAEPMTPPSAPSTAAAVAAPPAGSSESARDEAKDKPQASVAVETGGGVKGVNDAVAAAGSVSSGSSSPARDELAVVATNGNGHAAPVKATGNGSGTVTLSLGSTNVAFKIQEDAPSCAECGSIMVRNGSCYKCLNCGSTSGCS